MRLGLGISEFDNFLNGGILPRHVIEFTGDSGEGKSTFCMSFCVAVQRISDEDANGAAMYLNTSKIICTERLAQISQAMKAKYGDDLPPDPMSNIHLKQILKTDPGECFEDLSRFLRIDVPYYITHHNVKLIVIDSITSIFRDYQYSPDYFHEDQVLRLHRLGLVNQMLTYLRVTFDIYIIVVNEYSFGVPALASTWKGFIDFRYNIFNKLFTTEGNLKTHVESALSHNPDGKFPCSFCRYRATLKGNLKHHIKRPTTICPASKCQAKFKCHGLLKCHLFDECEHVQGLDKYAFMRYICLRGKQAEEKIMPLLKALNPEWGPECYDYTANNKRFPLPTTVRYGPKEGNQSIMPDCLIRTPDGRKIVVEFKTISRVWNIPAKDAILLEEGWGTGVTEPKEGGLITTPDHFYSHTISLQLHAVPDSSEHWILLYTAGPENEGSIAIATTSKDNSYFKNLYEDLTKSN